MSEFVEPKVKGHHCCDSFSMMRSLKHHGLGFLLLQLLLLSLVHSGVIPIPVWASAYTTSSDDLDDFDADRSSSGAASSVYSRSSNIGHGFGVNGDDEDDISSPDGSSPPSSPNGGQRGETEESTEGSDLQMAPPGAQPKEDMDTVEAIRRHWAMTISILSIIMGFMRNAVYYLHHFTGQRLSTSLYDS